MPSIIRAAGGVVWTGPPRSPRIAVIHRPHRKDWSLPKGKLHHDETAIVAAAREVLEETGLGVSLQRRLGLVRYRVDGVPKSVRYWTMRHIGGEFTANDEADDMQWLTEAEALSRLDFPTDREVVRRFYTQPVPDSTVLLVRHARAGKRSAWKQDDTLRPIDADGRRQAQALVGFAELFRPDRVLSAAPLRCYQTVQPLATKLGLAVEDGVGFSDRDFERRPTHSIRALTRVAAPNTVTVISSQGNAIPGLLDAIDPAQAPHDSRKGSVWAAYYARGRSVGCDYYARP